MVRRGTANPFSPVQIRVSPDQQKPEISASPLCCLYNSKNSSPIEVDRPLALCLIWSEGFFRKEKIVNPPLHLGFKEMFESTGRRASRFPFITLYTNILYIKGVSNDWILTRIVEPDRKFN